MRRVGTIAVGIGLALLAAGCNTLERNFLREGVGTEVTSADIVATSDIQDIYFGEVCRQAGLAVRQAPNGVLLCDESLMPPGAWTLFVQAGMNDIDRRCDAYLAWLDDRRRWREPFLKQLHSTAAATAAIMGLSGVGAVPIAIVGTAFGFAQETFVNLSGRLITEINQSTVQSLVLNRQNAYRGGLGNRLIPNRPAALYALRSYLRICMPMTIETEINTTMTGVDATGIAPPPMITPRTVQTPVVAVPLRARDPVVATPVVVTPVGGSSTAEERAITRGDFAKLQSFLCAPPEPSFGSPTRDAIWVFQDTLRLQATGTLGSRDLQELTRQSFARNACDDSKYANYFERTRINDATRVRQLKDVLNRLAPTPPLLDPTNATINEATRDKIAAVRTSQGIKEGRDSADLRRQVTKAFWLKVGPDQ
jgi:hypothetical protein